MWFWYCLEQLGRGLREIGCWMVRLGCNQIWRRRRIDLRGARLPLLGRHGLEKFRQRGPGLEQLLEDILRLGRQRPEPAEPTRARLFRARKPLDGLFWPRKGGAQFAHCAVAGAFTRAAVDAWKEGVDTPTPQFVREVIHPDARQHGGQLLQASDQPHDAVLE
jgi:hypothetical protein